jgi:UDP-2,4-diacetamido-2,4,6-trideoxy-beta-L-altropyranose hydrolase
VLGDLLIRADASSQIGAGHVLRCLALAQAWQQRGGGATFFSHCESEGIRRRVTQEGFRFVQIHSPYPDKGDLRDTLAAVMKIEREGNSRAPSWFVLDGYHFDSAYQEALKAAGLFLLVLDDMAHLPRYHVDLLVNAGMGANQCLYSHAGEGKLLLGTKYMLLRQEFLDRRKPNKEIPERAERILVTLGGADSKNVTSIVMEGLSQTQDLPWTARIVVGSVNPHAAELKRKAARAESKFEILQDVDQVPELMAWCDLAVSGGGATGCELAFMGVPSLLVILSENQRRLAEGLDGKCAVNLGHEKDLEPERVAHAVARLVSDREERIRMSREGRKLVDGLGADRVVDEMTKTIQRRAETSWRRC